MRQGQGAGNLGIGWMRPGGEGIEYLGAHVSIQVPCPSPRLVSPKNGQTGVSRDLNLYWPYHVEGLTYKVYLSTNFKDVKDRLDAALMAEGLTDTFLDPGRLAYGMKYYWCVDTVHPAPEDKLYKGSVWSFTVEPKSYLIENLAVKASRENEKSPAINVVNGSGLDGQTHGADGADMWQTAPGDLPATIEFRFEQPEYLDEIKVWNHNSLVEAILGFGAKDVLIEYSADDEDFSVLDSAVFKRAPGMDGYVTDNVIDFSSVPAQTVRMRINSAHGFLNQAGLSEVQFFALPVKARNLKPSDGTVLSKLETELSWQSARQSAQARIALSKDRSAVESGSAVIATLYVPVQKHMRYTVSDLNYASCYYWRIVDVNEAAVHDAVAVSAEATSPILHFRTPSTMAIDDYELYKDEEFLEIWGYWVDGYTDPNNNGSLVGINNEPETDPGNVYEGQQSLPLAYDNRVAPKSEATRTFDVPLNLRIGNPDRVGLYFKGIPYVFNGYYSQEGPESWTSLALNPLRSVTTTDDVLIGLALTGYTVDPVTSATFTNVSLEGDVRGDWTQVDIGGKHPDTTFINEDGAVSFEAQGYGIWGSQDDFRYVYRSLSGSGSITARIERFDRTHNWAMAGVMIRADDQPESGFAMMTLKGQDGISLRYRPRANMGSWSEGVNLDGTQALLSEPVWLKLERVSFNDAAQVYLRIADTKGKSVKVSYPDPAATRLGDWALLSIPLSDLNDIDVTQVKSITVGVEGNGAVGQILVDYLHLGRETLVNLPPCSSQ